MKTTNCMKKLLVAVVCLFAGIQAQAQFKGTVNQVPRNDWAPEAAVFNMAEIAEALGTDAATLLGALDSWMAEGSTDPNMFFYAAPSAPDTWSDGYTTGGEKGFWIAENGEIISYPDGAYYCNPVWSSEESTFSINIGLMPDALKYGVYNQTLNFALKYGEKTATFAIDFTVTGTEKVELPEIKTLKEAELNIVGEKEVTVEQYPRTSYDADGVALKLDDIIEKLGIPSGTVLQNYLGELLYCPVFDVETVGKKDSVSNESTAGAPGFWITDIRVDGQATGECAAAAYGGGDYFYAEQFAFNAENDTLTFNVGQYPGKCQGDEKLFVNFYIIYGDKAYRIRLNFNVLVKEQGTGLEGLTEVKREAIVIEQEPTTDYTPKVVKPDLEAIATALGCEVDGLTMKALDSSDSWGSSTANNGGFWFDGEGRVCSWGESAVMFIEPTNAPDGTKLDLTSFNVGQYPNAFAVGDEHTSYLYFFNGPEGEKYFTLAITLKAIEKVGASDDFAFNSVRTLTLPTIQVIPSADAYPIDDRITMDLALLKEYIGTDEPKLYGDAIEVDPEKPESQYSDAYSCDPKPGFWLNKAGKVSVWDDTETVVGICYGADGTFQFFQYPGRNNAGDVFTSTLYLVNPESGKMITLKFTLAFVNEIVEADIVGSEEILLPAASDKEVEIDIDMNKVADALGITLDELMNEESKYMHGMMDSGMYGEGMDCWNGLNFSLNGYYDVSGPISIMVEKKEDGTCKLIVFCNTEVKEDFTAFVFFCFQVGDKTYEFNATVLAPSAYAAGITTVANGKQTGRIYDLSGREVKHPARGLYIMDGKKIMIK